MAWIGLEVPCAKLTSGPFRIDKVRGQFLKNVINILGFFNKQAIVVNFYNKPISVGEVMTICCCTFSSLFVALHLLFLISAYIGVVWAFKKKKIYIYIFFFDGFMSPYA